MRWLTLGCSLLLASCAASSSGYYTQSVQSWRGGNTRDLARVWGAPSEVLPGRNGHTLYIYKRQSVIAANPTFSPSIGISPQDRGATIIAATPNIHTPESRGLTASCVTTFTANPAGRIIDTSVEGIHCSNNRDDTQSLANPARKS
jgi:hypothetical protein